MYSTLVADCELVQFAIFPHHEIAFCMSSTLTNDFLQLSTLQIIHSRNVAVSLISHAFSELI